MLRKLFFVMLCVPLIAHSTMSNVIVFGDSLSDIGNFPESETRLVPNTDKIAQHLYLPARNPVNLTHADHYTVPGLPEVVLSYPNECECAALFA